MAPREKPGPPMSLRNMHQNGVRAVIAACQACDTRPTSTWTHCPRRSSSQMSAGNSGAANVEGSESIRDRLGIQGATVTARRTIG
jgi:hypothetical protein